jgi:hypothetical protein
MVSLHAFRFSENFRNFQGQSCTFAGVLLPWNSQHKHTDTAQLTEVMSHRGQCDIGYSELIFHVQEADIKPAVIYPLHAAIQNCILFIQAPVA